MRRRTEREEVRDAGLMIATLGLVCIVVALCGVDWRLGVGALGATMTLLGSVAYRYGG